MCRVCPGEDRLGRARRFCRASLGTTGGEGVRSFGELQVVSAADFLVQGFTHTFPFIFSFSF